jgi:cell wall-associated NlpC family hydrolase
VAPTMPYGYYKPKALVVDQHYVQREVIHKPVVVPATPVTSPVTPVNTSVGTFNQRVLDAARSQIGVPYVWGGETPGVAFDCSGLTEYAYSRAGHWIPRIANDQFHFFRMIPKSQARPGDLVFFHNDSDPSSYVYHVGIYMGGEDMMIVAPDAGQDVQVQSFAWGGNTVTFGTLDIR